MWGWRGTVVVPRGVGWRSGLAAVFWVCYNKTIFSKIHSDITTTATEEHYIIRITGNTESSRDVVIASSGIAFCAGVFGYLRLIRSRVDQLRHSLSAVLR